MGTTDRRIYARVPASFKVEYIHAEEYIISFNKDVSVDGMYILAEEPPPPGSHLKLIFAIGDLKDVEVPAIVAWTDIGGAPSEHGMGVQFLEPPPEEVKKTILEKVSHIKILQKNGKWA